jgi:tight adherence protein C
LDALVPSVLIGTAIVLPGVFRYLPEVDREEVLTRTGTRLLNEEEKNLTAMMISRAGLDIRPEYFYGLKVSLASLYIIFTVFISMLSPISIIMLVLAPLMFYLPDMWLNSKINARKAELKKKLDDFAMYLSTSLSSDPDMINALSEASKSTGGVYEEEIGRVIKENATSQRLTDALIDMAVRTDVDELNTLVSTLCQIYDHGAPAAEKMKQFSDKVRDAKKFNVIEQSGKLSIRLIFVVLIFMLLPVMMVIGYPAIYSLMNAF